MAFPETTLITDFTGTGVSPITNFSNLSGGASALYTDTGTIADGTTQGYNYYNVGTYAQPLDATCIIGHFGVSGNRISLIVVQNPGASWNGYRIGMIRGVNVLTFRRYDNGVETEIGTNPSYTPAEGDTFGVRFHANGQMEVYIKVGAGSWTSQGIIGTDTTYTGSFYVGYHVEASWSSGGDGESIDDLRAGGNVADAGVAPSVSDTATIAEDVKMHMPISLKMMKLP